MAQAIKQPNIHSNKNRGNTIQHTSATRVVSLSKSYPNSVTFYQQIAMARKGVPSNRLNSIVKRTGLSLGDWSRYIHLSERTIQRHVKKKVAFRMPQAERIIEIEALVKLGDKVFGDHTKFIQWLKSSNVAFGGKVPSSFLDTSAGIHIVSSELHRMEHGIFA